jgi:hypothetical protein
MLNYYKCSKCNDVTCSSEDVLDKLVCTQRFVNQTSKVCAGSYIQITKEEYDKLQMAFNYIGLFEAIYEHSTEDDYDEYCKICKTLKRNVLTDIEYFFENLRNNNDNG